MTDRATLHKRERRIKARNFTLRVKRRSSCVDCGYDENPNALQFDHKDKDKKSVNISRLVSKGVKINVLKEEMRKCEIRCANCHSIKTLNNEDWRNNVNHQICYTDTLT